MKCQIIKCVLILAAIVSCAVHAQEAQDAIDKGIIAAKSQDYLLAIRYFEDARKIAPNSPEIFYNLGLAESQIPGRELRAICWFGAFLTTSPNSPKAAAIKEQIKVLDVKSQSNISKLIRSAQNAANGLDGNERIRRLAYIVDLWTDSEDYSEALAVAKGLDHANKWDLTFRLKTTVARAQIIAGDFDGATDVVASIAPEDLKNEKNIVNDLDIPSLQSDSIPRRPLESLALALALSGDFSGEERIARRFGITIPGFSANDFAQAKTNGALSRAGIKYPLSIETARAWLRQPPNWPMQGKDYKELVPTVSNWLEILNNDSSKKELTFTTTIYDNSIALNTSIYLNFGEFLKTQQSTDPGELCDTLRQVADRMIKTQHFVEQIVKQIKQPETK